VTSSGLERLIATAYRLLGLVTFLTVGPTEARAWTVSEGATAPEAAGVIHSDFERGFIKAEVIAYDDYINGGGEAGAREAGRLRIEGREYRIATVTSSTSVTTSEARSRRQGSAGRAEFGLYPREQLGRTGPTPCTLPERERCSGSQVDPSPRTVDQDVDVQRHAPDRRAHDRMDRDVVTLEHMQPRYPAEDDQHRTHRLLRRAGEGKRLDASERLSHRRLRRDARS
jgi:hypothetical protein